MGLPWGAIISAIGSIAGGVLGSRGASSAANAQVAASDRAIGEQRRQYDLMRGDLAPYMWQGTQAINQLGSLYGFSPAPPSYGQPTGGYWNGAAPNQLPGARTSDYGGLPLYAAQNSIGERLTGGLIKPLGNVLFGKKPWIYRTNENGMIEFNGKNSGKDQLGGYINPQTGEVWLSHDPYGSKELLQNYLRTGEGELPKNASRFGQAVAALRGAGWNYNDPNVGDPNLTYGNAYSSDMASPNGMAGFWLSPDYEFRRTEGTRGIEQSAAARGGALSGNAIKEAQRYSSGLASQEFGNYFNRLATIAGIGQTATNTGVVAGQGYADSIGTGLLGQGNARASGILGQTNSWVNALDGLGNAVGGYLDSRQQPVNNMNTLTPLSVTSRYVYPSGGLNFTPQWQPGYQYSPPPG